MWSTRILRRLPALLGACLIATALQAAPAPDQALVGKWEVYEPTPSNVVEFLPDHTLRLYLTRKQGGKNNIHWIGGTWSLSENLILTSTLTFNGRSDTDRVKISFANGEMWLVDHQGNTTRHRRLKGRLPKRFRW